MQNWSMVKDTCESLLGLLILTVVAVIGCAFSLVAIGVFAAAFVIFTIWSPFAIVIDLFRKK